jgi:hypothetical protein
MAEADSKTENSKKKEKPITLPDKPKEVKKPKKVEKWVIPYIVDKNENPDIHYWTLGIHRWILIFSSITFIVTIPIFILAVIEYSIGKNDREESRFLNRKKEFIITFPQNGDTVYNNIPVEVFSPFKEKKYHYLMLISSDFIGEARIQGKLMKMSDAGNWKGNARFEDQNSGNGESYYIKCVATDSTLVIGRKYPLPSEAIESSSIIKVIHKKIIHSKINSTKSDSVQPQATTLPKITIKFLNNNDHVNTIEKIEGLSIAKKKNYYLIVTSSGPYSRTWIMGNIIISASGKWCGTAQFGTNQFGKGEDFYIKCIGTNSELKNGILVEALPRDAIESQTIKVIRK